MALFQQTFIHYHAPQQETGMEPCMALFFQCVPTNFPRITFPCSLNNHSLPSSLSLCIIYLQFYFLYSSFFLITRICLTYRVFNYLVFQLKSHLSEKKFLNHFHLSFPLFIPHSLSTINWGNLFITKLQLNLDSSDAEFKIILHYSHHKAEKICW